MTVKPFPVLIIFWQLNRLREALQDREEHKKMIDQDAEVPG